MNVDFRNVPKYYSSKMQEKMADVLMDPKGNGPEIHYHMIRGGKDQRNITILEPGTISGEYIKTYGHYHIGLEETYSILFGEGIVLLQKLALDENGNMVSGIVEEFKAFQVKPGNEVFMPSFWGHLLVNIGETYFVTEDNTDVNFDDKTPQNAKNYADYEPVKKMQGFAYYVVEKDEKPAFKRNPNYKEIRKEDLGGLTKIS